MSASVKITWRLKRMWVQRLSPITGQPERIMATVQDSNLYAFSGPAALAGRLDGIVEAYASPLPRKIDVLARLTQFLNRSFDLPVYAEDTASPSFWSKGR